MLKKVFITAICYFAFSNLFGQYYTSAQIDVIAQNKTAGEGDLYQDTVKDKYYVGLTSGGLSQINTDDDAVKRIINSQLNDSLKGVIFPIWAEESGGLNSNAFEWAYGNGDDAQANFGIVLPTNCELFAVGLTLFDGSAEVEVYKNGIATGATTGTGNVGATLNTLSTPVSFARGDNLNFRTKTASGANSGGKVVAWLRILTKMPTYKRYNEIGAPSGVIGVDGDEYLDISTGDLYINEQGGWSFKLNIKGPSGTAVNRSVIQVTNTVSANVNTAAGVQFSWIDVALGNIETNNLSAFSVANDGITVVNSGLYKITVFQYQVGTSSARNNASLRFTIDGVLQPGIGANSYQRKASGHDESTASLVKIMNVASGEKIGIKNVAMGATGNVTCPTGTLIFIIEKL